MATAKTRDKTFESITAFIVEDGTDLIQKELKFRLADNEIGQMYMVDFDFIPLASAPAGNSGIALSLDPDSNLEPMSDDVEDLEYLGGAYVSGDEALLLGNIGKTLAFAKPINFGTNVGITVQASTALRVGGVWVVTIWYVRKKASDVELAKILLKRR